jgi:TRAP-type C4-dicarboxylate transport system permease small subunit
VKAGPSADLSQVPKRDFRTVFRAVTGAAASIAGVGIALLMLPTVIDVSYRIVFGPSVPGLLEYSEVGLVAVAFLGMAATLQRGAHISTPIFTNALPPRAATVVRLLGSALVWLLLLALVIGTTATAVASIRISEYRFGMTQTAIWPAKLVIAIGLLLFLGEQTIQIVDGVRKLVLLRARPELPDPHSTSKAGTRGQ